MKRKTKLVITFVLLSLIFLSSCEQTPANEIRIGFFPNLTHSQAVYGYANGDFEKAFGEGYKVKWQSFNAGPAEMEALLAGEIDIGYIGPIPAVTGYLKSNGGVKIIAGATLNGAMLVTRKDIIIDEIIELENSTIAVPQFGNTQHLCLLNILSHYGLSSIEKGGNVKIIESSNSDIKILMDKGSIDAALIPEPWATRMIDEIGVNILLDSDEVWSTGDYSTAVVIVNTEFYEKNKDVIKRFLSTHVAITKYINEYPEEAMAKINNKLGSLTGNYLNDRVLVNSFSNMTVTFDPSISSINDFMTIYVNELGQNVPNKNEIYDFEILNELLLENNLNEIKVKP